MTSNSNRIPWLVAIIAAIIAIAAVSLYASGRLQPASAAVAPQPPAAAAGTVEPSLATLPPRATMAISAPGAGAMSATDSGERPPPTPAELEQERLAMAREFQARPADPAGGSRRELAMMQALKKPELVATKSSPDDLHAECRMGGCRLTATFANQMDATDWAVFYLTSLGGTQVGRARQAIQLNPDGTAQLQLYTENPRQ